MMISVIISMAIGVVAAGGFNLRALVGLLIAAIFIALVMVKRNDPASWEAAHEPRAYSLRLRSEGVTSQLQAVINAYESGNSTLLADEIARARELLH